MMMSKSQAQQTSSLLFLDEEENDLEDAENVVIDTALPFDKCLSVDKQCEEEENEDKKNREMLEYQRLLGDAKTTLKDSKKQIDNLFGKEILFKYRLNYVILGIFGLVMSVTLIYFSPITIKSNINDSDIIVNTMKLFLNGIIAIMIIIGVILVFILTANVFAPIKRDLIEKKMSRDDYLINSNTIDCPMKIKRELFDDLVEYKYLYISYDKKENILKFYNDYYSDAINTYNLNKHKNFTDRDSLEYQYWYLCKQLEDGKFYRIADIITDKATKEKDVHE
jgi:hypothetical protein